MAKFTIYSPNGTALYTGTPSFTGQYMKPGMLEFREIGSPTTLELTAGCYVDYTRTGFRYRIYTVPQVKKQARSLSYGAALLYQGVQLFDASKMLEYCPFRDLVAGDNRIHFSTQPSISTYEGCDGLARRFEACLRDQYDVDGVQSWKVRIATFDENPDLYELMLEPREFTVSGVNLLEALDKVYEIWPDVGWVYKVEDGIDTIVIGGGGINANEGTYAYGKGQGLTSLTRTVANADELANRIYAYGSSRNMLPRWYNKKEIKDADSVDIQNLMIPISEWGTTDVEGVELPDASKAYVENADSVAKMGLRPKTVYFEGKNEYPAIYPSIRDVTIGMVRQAMQPTDKYYPNTLIYQNPDVRVDKLMSAQLSFDSGQAATDGRSSIATDYDDFTAEGSGTAPASLQYLQKINLSPFLTRDISLNEYGDVSISVGVSASGSVTTTLGYVGIIISAYSVEDNVETLIQTSETKMVAPSSGSIWTLTNAYLKVTNTTVPSGANIRIKANIVLGKSNQSSDGEYSYSFSGSSTTKVSRYRAKTFRVTLRQLGFDISEQAAIGEGKTIAMRSGDCAGRSFAINDVQYDNGRDCWVIECWRTEDESLAQWFPNSDFKVRKDDEFVLLDIAMPGIYVDMAEQKLLQAAEDLLSDTATERWQFIPEIDAKFMVENSRTIRAGEFLALLDPDIIDGGDGQGIRYFRTSGGDYYLTSNGEKILLSGSGGVARALVDTIVINEGEAAIPTYKVTLRDRKRKTWTESESPAESSSKSVGQASDDGSGYIDLSNYVTKEDFEALSERVGILEGESFFTLDESGNVTLKSEYQNLWVPGWLAAGGVGTGGGGSVGSLYDLLEVDSETSPSQNDVFYYNGTKWTSIAVKTINGNSILGSGNIVVSGGGGSGSSVAWGTPGSDYIPLTVDGTTKNLLTSHQSLTNYALKTGGSSYNFRVSTLILPNGTLGEYTGSGYNDERIKFTYTAGSSMNTAILAYLTDIPTALKCPNALTFGNKTYDGSAAREILASDIGAASASDLSALAGRVTSIEGWFEVVNVGTAQSPEYALHAKSGYAIYSDSWISAGGVGSGGGGGGSSTLSGLVDVSISNPSSNDVLTYDGSTSHWVNTAKNTFLSGYATQTWVQNRGYLTQSSLANYVTLTGTQTITGAKTFSANLSVGGNISVNSLNTIDQSNPTMSLFNYGARATKSFNAYGSAINLRSCDANGDQTNILSVQSNLITVNSKIIPNYMTGLDLGGSSSNQRWQTIYGEGANLSGDLTMGATSHIDIGPLRIEYDSTNKALHITKVSSSDTENYGIYADGFVSAGGVQATS